MRARTVTAAEHRCSACAAPTDDEMCARCRDFRDDLPPELSLGGWVRVKGEQRVYRLLGFHRDGSARCYGGDKNPEGHRAWRAIPVDQLVPADNPYGDGRDG